MLPAKVVEREVERQCCLHVEEALLGAAQASRFRNSAASVYCPERSKQTRVSGAQRQILDFAGPPSDKAAGPFPTARCFATPRPVRNKTPRVWGISFDGCCELPDSIA